METIQVQPNFYSELPTSESIDNSIKGHEESIDYRRECMTQRMENYYNCLDEYSFGGICDKAAEEAIRQSKNNIRLLQEQKTTGASIEEFTLSTLTDLDGNLVSDKLVQGMYGECWLIGSGDSVQFVGVAKRSATYLKKGYKLMERVFTIEYYYLTKTTKDGDLQIRSRVLSETLRDVVDISRPNTWLRRPLWIALN